MEGEKPRKSTKEGPTLKKTAKQTPGIDVKKKRKTMSAPPAAILKTPKKTPAGKLHGKYLEEVKKIDKPTADKDRNTLRTLSISDIRKNPRILIPKKKESDEDRILNRRAEMVKRIRAYTSKCGKDSYTLNYTQVASSHEYKIGLGEIFLRVKRLKIEKVGKEPIIAKRMVVPSGQHKGRVGFCDINTKEYIATFSGDRVTILDNKEEVDINNPKSVTAHISTLDKEDKARKTHAKEYKQTEELQTTSSKLGKKIVISAERIEKIRNKIGGLEGLSIQDRLKKVIEYVTIPENYIGARHCGNWVERVYAIAGITRKKNLYHNIKYAFNNGTIKDGWKAKSDESRYDARIEGKFASTRLLNNLQVGDWIYINNRNHYDYAGNHSGIFLGWADKPAKKAIIACWFENKKGRQKITTYNFNNTPITHISRGTTTNDILPRTTSTSETQDKNNYEYRSVPDVNENEAVSKRKKEWKGDYLRPSVSETKKEYLKVATEMAKKACAGTKVNWKVMLAQSILETGWGTSKIAKKMKNFFGIKAHELQKQRDRAYRSMYESFLDYKHKMLSTRYKHALQYNNNPMMALACIALSGYCPGKTYIRSVGRVLRHISRKYNLTLGVINYNELIAHMRKHNPSKLSVEQMNDRLRPAAKAGYIKGFPG